MYYGSKVICAIISKKEYIKSLKMAHCKKMHAIKKKIDKMLNMAKSKILWSSQYLIQIEMFQKMCV